MYIQTRPFSFPLLTFLRDVDLYFTLIDSFIYRLQLGYVQYHVRPVSCITSGICLQIYSLTCVTTLSQAGLPYQPGDVLSFASLVHG